MGNLIKSKTDNEKSAFEHKVKRSSDVFETQSNQ